MGGNKIVQLTYRKSYGTVVPEEVHEVSGFSVLRDRFFGFKPYEGNKDNVEAQGSSIVRIPVHFTIGSGSVNWPASCGPYLW